jgi:hypothetical protein
MQLGKQAVVSFIEREVGPDRAREAAQHLPDQVDYERHDALLRQFGVNPQDMVRQLGGVAGEGPMHCTGSGEAPGTTGPVDGTEDDYESGAGDGGTHPRA